jgi:hypothetical protein
LGIDRIGSGGSAPPQAPSSGDGATGARPEKARFEVAGAPVAAAKAGEVQASAALDGVRSGALDVNGYVDAKVQEATAHLSHLSAAQLHAVQAVVRGQLLADPHLADLVQHATGSPVPKDEE